MALDGVSAGNRLLAFGKVDPGTCLNAVWRAFGSPKSDGRYPYATATQALKRARELGAIKGYNINDAPEGSVLFWSNVWGYWKSAPGRTDAGHIAIKGPNNTVTTIDLPARGRVGRVKPSAIWSHIRFEGYAYGPGSFLGHDVIPAGAIRPLSTSAPAAPKPKRNKMYIAWDTIGTGYFGTPEGLVRVDNTDHMGVLRRFIAGEDTFNLVQIGWVQDYIARCRAVGEKTIRDDIGYIHEASPNSLLAIHNTVKAKSVTVDSSAIASQVSKAVADVITKQGVSVNVAGITKAVDDVLADNFAAIPGAVNLDASKRLGA